MQDARTLTLGFRGFKINAIIGVGPEERLIPQPLEIDLSLNVQTGVIDDHLDRSVSYAELPALVTDQALKEPMLLETLAEAILDAVLAYNPKITMAEIEIRKPKALKDGAIAFVRMKKDWA